MRVAVITNKLIMGGVERALINLLNSQEYMNYEIDLYLFDINGEWMNKLPKKINVVKIEKENTFSLNSIINRVYLRVYKNNYHELCYINAKLLKSNNNIMYDKVISYHAPVSLSVFYALYNLKAKEKILYIHGDVIKCKVDRSFMKQYYNLFNTIKCVSNDAYNVFTQTFPDLIDKTIIEYNIINKAEIFLLSNEVCDNMDRNCYNILTVARLSEPKGLELAIKTMKLLSIYENIKWYIIGEGELQEKLCSLIDKCGLNNKIVLLGAKDNPYKYMKNCNVYVQPSKHEGYCLTLAEALLLNKRCICTPFAGAYEQINETNGVIVPYDEYKMFETLLKEYKNWSIK